jgi:hypothetical protein
VGMGKRRGTASTVVSVGKVAAILDGHTRGLPDADPDASCTFIRSWTLTSTTPDAGGREPALRIAVSVRRRFADDRPDEIDPTRSYEQLTGAGEDLVAAGFAVEQVFEGWRTVALDVSAAPDASRRGWFGRRKAVAAAPAGDGPTVPAESPAAASEAGGTTAKPADVAEAAGETVAEPADGPEPVPVG